MLGYGPTSTVQPTEWATEAARVGHPFHGLDWLVLRVLLALLSLVCSAGLQGFQYK
jgi:hypothetical protein